VSKTVFAPRRLTKTPALCMYIILYTEWHDFLYFSFDSGKLRGQLYLTYNQYNVYVYCTLFQNIYKRTIYIYYFFVLLSHTDTHTTFGSRIVVSILYNTYVVYYNKCNCRSSFRSQKWSRRARVLGFVVFT